MKSGKNRLLKLSLGILTTVFFGCGKEGNLGNEVASGLNNIEQVADASASEKTTKIATKEQVDKLLDMFKGVVAENGNLKKLVEELTNKDNERKTIEEKLLTSTGPEKEDLEDKLLILEREMQQKKVDGQKETKRLIKENNTLQARVLDLEKEIKATQNAFVDSKCDCNELFDRVEKLLKNVEKKKAELNDPEYILGVGKKAFRATKPDVFTAYELGVKIGFKSYIKLIDNEIAPLKGELNKKRGGENVRDERIDDCNKKIDELINWKENNADNDKISVLEKCYIKFDKDTLEKTGVNYESKKLADLLNSDDSINERDRSIIRRFCVSYGLRDLKTNRKEIAIFYSALFGKSIKNIKKISEPIYEHIYNAHSISIVDSLKGIGTTHGGLNTRILDLINSIKSKDDSVNGMKKIIDGCKFLSLGNLHELAGLAKGGKRSNFKDIKNVFDFQDIDNPVVVLDNLNSDNRTDWCGWYYNNVPTYMEYSMFYGANFSKKDMKNVYSKNEEAKKFVNQKVEVDENLE